ncbi:hypothetical protein [Stutzerimonas nitrititolerans]|uniref:hypothetical protein n=1 Tax=Stutzerimonas nitrititolerans TaxID=2482751 RepID=UPI0028AD8592|nr:hypothetical protein [Stutzerimonas nitrititolerans]
MSSPVDPAPTPSLEERYKLACEGAVAQSTRRLLFTHCTQNMEELGHYHADIVFSHGGTGILLKYNELFFILTAQHVLDENYAAAQNESPFFIPLRSAEGFSEGGLDQLGFPVRGWRIGEGIAGEVPNIDFEDIVLVELGHPMRYPSTFLDLDDPSEVARHAGPLDPEEGYLVVSGYPNKHNPIDYPFAEVNCVATLNRHIFWGRYTPAEGLSALKLQASLSHGEMNGISGGSVFTFAAPNSPSQWAGMVQRADAGVVNFYPASLIVPAITNYLECSNFEIDPAASLSDPVVLASPDAVEARRKIHGGLRRLETNGQAQVD